MHEKRVVYHMNKKGTSNVVIKRWEFFVIAASVTLTALLYEFSSKGLA